MYMEVIEARVCSLYYPPKVGVKDLFYRARVSFTSYLHHGLNNEVQILRFSIWYNNNVFDMDDDIIFVLYLIISPLDDISTNSLVYQILITYR